MYGQPNHDIAKFVVAGINYKKTDAAIRGHFAVSSGNYERIIAEALLSGIQEIFILSTCNRTEVYAIANDPSQLIDLLCAHTDGDSEIFSSMAYIKSGLQAVEHLFSVSAGLDSQILGDYEIVGQIKQAVKFAKEHGSIGAFTERLVNAVLQSSKTIKNQTELSGGTVSVSFSAVQYIKQNVKDISNKKILLSGIGKIGRNTCRNLVDYLETKNITLVNRTDEKALELATELGLNFVPFEQLNAEVASADIILVSTNASLPTILKKDIEGNGNKVIIDLSIPYNVEVAVKELPGVTLVNVDDLSKLKDKTLNKRKAEVPKANGIIAEHIAEFEEWHEMRKNVPLLRAVKTKLQEIHGNSVFFNTSQHCIGAPLADHHDKIQKVINVMAVKMRTHNQKGCHYIQAINEFITPGINI
ncbi:MAG: glutamyl-tRNA reductase [Flavitalea sp.]